MPIRVHFDSLTELHPADHPCQHEIPTAKRIRKLLLHREEVDRLYGEAQVKGRALVVLKLYWKNGKVKAEVGVGTDKLAHGKRADLKKRAVDREKARELARFKSQTRVTVPPSDAPGLVVHGRLL